MIEKGQTTSNDIVYEWIIVEDFTEEELGRFSKAHAIPLDLYALNKESDISYYNALDTDHHGQLNVLHLPVWEKKRYGTIQQANSTVTFVYSEELVVCVLSGLDSQWMADQLKSHTSPHHAMVETINLLYNDVEDRLLLLKQSIEDLMKEAKEKADRDVLLNVTDLEQELVFFSRRIDDFDETISRWSEDSIILNTTQTSEREIIALRINKSQYNSHLYKDLIESTSGLLSDSIDNKLNSIMEFLESVALVISIPTLIFSLFGMNTGGLVGRQSPFGTVVVIAGSLLLGIVMALYLKRKDYM